MQRNRPVLHDRDRNNASRSEHPIMTPGVDGVTDSSGFADLAGIAFANEVNY
jgi:hypothetical protein